MKKLIKILMVSMICLGLTACGEKKAAKAETTDDVAKIAEDNDLNDEALTIQVCFGNLVLLEWSLVWHLMLEMIQSSTM